MDNQQPSLLTINKTGPKIKDLRNIKFGFLKPIKYEQRKHGSGWICKCKCGKECFVRTYKLVNNKQFACINCTASLVQTRKTNISNLGLKRRIFREYKRGAINRNYSFILTEKEFFNLIIQDCYFCGQKPVLYKQDISYQNICEENFKRNGIDRLDNSKGYTKENSVTCCKYCNYAKNDQSKESFLNHVKKIYLYNQKKGSTTIPAGSTSQVNGDGNSNYPIKG